VALSADASAHTPYSLVPLALPLAVGDLALAEMEVGNDGDEGTGDAITVIAATETLSGSALRPALYAPQPSSIHDGDEGTGDAITVIAAPSARAT
jgi:hypothetical protein